MALEDNLLNIAIDHQKEAEIQAFKYAIIEEVSRLEHKIDCIYELLKKMEDNHGK